METIRSAARITAVILALACLAFVGCSKKTPESADGATTEGKVDSTAGPRDLTKLTGKPLGRKVRIFVVDSYNREYLWSQSTHKGLCDAMLSRGYLDSAEQAAQYTRADKTDSSKAVIMRVWMDTKRKSSKGEIGNTLQVIMEDLAVFKPDLVLLGDDNATNYIGNLLLDTQTPVVFWGVNGIPLKYGLVASMDVPGHNVTGVWQSGYLVESVELLRKLVPGVKTFAILACDSVTSRSKVKQLQVLCADGRVPLELKATVTTNSFEEFRKRTLELAETVDAFFILNHDTMKDAEGRHVDMMTVGKWYLTNVRKPEASHEDQFVREGMLCTANDSGYKQGYEAFMMATEILEGRQNPSHMKPRTPTRGPMMVSRPRAEALGISLADKKDVIEEIVEKALALEQQPR